MKLNGVKIVKTKIGKNGLITYYFKTPYEDKVISTGNLNFHLKPNDACDSNR